MGRRIEASTTTPADIGALEQHCRDAAWKIRWQGFHGEEGSPLERKVKRGLKRAAEMADLRERLAFYIGLAEEIWPAVEAMELGPFGGSTTLDAAAIDAWREVLGG